MMETDNKPFKIYSASAGSGKTFTIVKEYLSLCLGDNADAYKEILAVTFTNKAANEMKAKILGFLLGIINESTDEDVLLMRNYLIEKTSATNEMLTERSKTLYSKILHNYSDMSVSTIDSFVQHLSRSFARELGLPNQYGVMLDENDLVDEIIQLLSDEVGHNAFITKTLSNFIEYKLSEEKTWNIKTVIGGFIEKLLAEDSYGNSGNHCVTEIDEDKFEEIKKYISGNIESAKIDIDGIVNYITKKEDELGITIQDYSGKESRGLPAIKKKMRNGVSNVLTDTTSQMFSGDKEWKDKKSKIAGDDILNVYIDAVKQYNELYIKMFILTSIKKDLHLYVLRNHILKLIDRYIYDSSQVHISEFNKRISDLLGDCSVPFIYERIGEKYRHYFIDEFQDTSILQWQNFLPLVDNSLAQGNMNLLVGDAKQSIYRFRGGEVEQIINLPKIYKKSDGEFSNSCEEQFVNSADRHSLDTNYRSCRNIVKFNNTFFRFAQNYVADKDIESTLEHVFDDTEQKYTKKGGMVSVEMFSGELENKEYKEKVMSSMLSRIKDLHQEGYKYKDITIQVSKNKEGTEIANFLTENGIEVVSADSVQLQTSDKIQLIISTLQYIVDNLNAVTLRTVSFYFEKTHPEKTFNAAAFADDIQSIHNQAYSLYDMCADVCRYYGFNVLEDVFVQYFMNMLYNWQNTHSAGVDVFLEYWEKKKGKLTVQITGDLDSVNIMTIHKSKGLEFKVVLYPFAYTMLKGSKGLTQNKMWVKCNENEYTKDIPYLDAFMLSITKENLEGTSYEDILKREMQKTKLDILDVIYVSMTRAKERLYIYTRDIEAKKDTKSESYNIFSDFFNSDLNINHIAKEGDDGQYYDYFIKKEDITLEEKEDSKVYKYEIDSVIGDKSQKSKPKPEVLEVSDSDTIPQAMKWYEKLSIEADPTKVWSSKDSFLPNEWGSLVHEIFSKIKTLDDASHAVKPYVNDGTIDSEKADELIEAFRDITEIECLKPAYSADAKVMNELDIHTIEGTAVRPDRFVTTPDGAILIDYKTGKPDKAYHNQLKKYMAALKNMNDRQNIKAYLVYIGKEINVEEVSL